jgi:hypothetical protein
VAGARTLIALPRDLQPLTDNESDDVLEHAFRGRDVAGGRGGYLEYRRDGAYICQAGRAFSNEPRHGVAFWRNCDKSSWPRTGRATSVARARGRAALVKLASSSIPTPAGRGLRNRDAPCKTGSLGHQPPATRLNSLVGNYN